MYPILYFLNIIIIIPDIYTLYLILFVFCSVPDTVWRINIDDPSEGKSLAMDAVDERWWEQTDLVKLILASNQLTEISPQISLLGALVTLDVSMLTYYFTQ